MEKEKEGKGEESEVEREGNRVGRYGDECVCGFYSAVQGAFGGGWRLGSRLELVLGGRRGRERQGGKDMEGKRELCRPVYYVRHLERMVH